MKRIALCVSTICLMVGITNAQNLLYNGDFNLNIDGNSEPDGWSVWQWGEGWAAYKNPADSWAKDGTPYINSGEWGAWDAGGGGWYQVVPGTAGNFYTFSSWCATENWDWPAGEMRLIFLNDVSAVIRQDNYHTAEWQPSMPWTQFSMTSLAPEGTTQVKAEFATWGARGAVMWDDAVLTSVVPEPSTLTLAILGLGSLLLRKKLAA